MNFLKRITNLGIKEEHNLSEKKRIKLLNRIVLLFSTLVTIKLIQEVLVADLTGFIVTAAITTAFLLTLVLHYFNKTVFAKVYFTAMMILAVMAVNMLFGSAVGSEFGLFPIIVAIIIFFEHQTVRILWVAFFLLCFGISMLFLWYNEPLLIHNLSPSTYYYMFIFCAGAVFLASSFFINENQNYESQMTELLNRLKTQNEGLETANKELERFAFVASHDLKTPLRNINSFLNLIQRKIKRGQTEEITEYLEFATLNAKRMYNLIEDILEFSRFTNDRDISFQNEDLNEVVGIAISNIEDMIQSKNAVINCDELPTVYSNKTQMVSLFQNIISNGIKYNESDVPTIDITCKNSDKVCTILIKDNGIGIEKEYQEKIFEMFYRLHNQGEYEGSGIGLSSCKKIVMYHDGEITLNSELNQGTTFSIILPKISI